MNRTSPVVMLAVVVIAALIGYLTMPRYRAPAVGGEERLRQRAVEFYRAQKQVDYLAMARMFTPARQLADGEALKGDARDRARESARFSESTKSDLKKTANAITSDLIDVEVKGRWAVTRGESTVFTEGHQLDVPLDDMVWVEVEGDWWVYSMTPDELNAYGNAADFARKVLLDRKGAGAGGYGVSVGGDSEETGSRDAESPGSL